MPPSLSYNVPIRKCLDEIHTQCVQTIASSSSSSSARIQITTSGNCSIQSVLQIYTQKFIHINHVIVERWAYIYIYQLSTYIIVDHTIEHINLCARPIRLCCFTSFACSRIRNISTHPPWLANKCGSLQFSSNEPVYDAAPYCTTAPPKRSCHEERQSSHDFENFEWISCPGGKRAR